MAPRLGRRKEGVLLPFHDNVFTQARIGGREREARGDETRREERKKRRKERGEERRGEKGRGE